MKVNYSLSHSLIAAEVSSTVDLIINFNAGKIDNSSPRRPLNLSLVIDRSGSMAGQPLRYAIQAAQKLVEYLTPEDFLAVIIYDDTPETIIPSQPVKDKAAIKSRLGKVRAGGCTNLSGGWLMGCEQVQSQLNSECLNRVLLLTDGQANFGIIDPKVLTNTARKQAYQGIITTTLGFGTHFNEDLLIDMANAAGGNFYFIQSPDDASDVFRIELESLLSVAAQNLTVTLQPEESVKITEVLNNYRSQVVGNNLEVFVGDVYEVEAKQLALQLAIPPHTKTGETKVATITYKYQSLVEGSIEQLTKQILINLTVGSAEEASQIEPDSAVFELASKLRIAQIKEQAIALADNRDYQGAAEKLRAAIKGLKLKLLDEIFEVAEEMEQLEHYAQRLESRNFDSASRKEMRDQSYQARGRNRGDLNLRGIAGGEADSLEAISSFEQGILVKCFREGGKLRVKVISEGYNPELNVQFPRSIRQEGTTYVVDEIKLSANGSFYRVSGKIRRLVKPGQEHAASSPTAKSGPKTQKLHSAKATGSLADLETVDSVGDGVIVQCVKEGSKLRARVVSDGYNPNYNIRFPRNIRAEGVLYVVDQVKETAQGGSYIAYGKIRKLLQ
ncbi:MAG: VWA domain-containing protein [Symploca sp. SIO1C4]|uniref:VWA domain-containing protein n=1 Tax=Symploca sp. SIO1C4 TaxID=2607765 RepID=A0A6B3N8F4_9CYAN|nr:VWA domain-containing protein [Symploca sp. SIO1C4]